jgi:radical SAM protein with 4Fe4S-binding SPASM domain
MANRDAMMTIETFEAHYKFLPHIMRHYNEERFTTTFFGGEPLLNWELLLHAMGVLDRDERCEQIVLPTNGILLNSERMKILAAHNVNISLSFDGLWHPEYKTGGITKFIKDYGIKQCKAMVSPANIRKRTLRENYEFFMQYLNIPSPDFTLVRDDIWTLDDVEEFEDQLDELAAFVIYYNKMAKAHGLEHGTLPGIFSLYILDTIAGDRYGKRSFGCFAGCHGGGFMPDGKVYACARFGSEGKYPLFDSVIQKIWDGKAIIALREQSNPQYYAKCLGVERNKPCELYEYCNAGCTFSQFDGKQCAPVDSVCRLYKACYNQAFRIVDELKDCETFQNLMKGLLRSFDNG